MPIQKFKCGEAVATDILLVGFPAYQGLPYPLSLPLLGLPSTGWIRRGFRRGPELPPAKLA
jgi:hypothetical protein